jgi:hypothetical protein
LGIRLLAVSLPMFAQGVDDPDRSQDLKIARS